MTESLLKTETAYFGGGCFWGMEYYFQKESGVNSVMPGYMGGKTAHPKYEEVCTGATGHAEIVQVIFDNSQLDFKKLCRLFFEIHDPTQLNRQGPDIGHQYRSVIFYDNLLQKEIAEKLIAELRDKNYDVKTELVMAKEFWIAENYHQNYYGKTGKEPYCHFYTKRF